MFSNAIVLIYLGSVIYIYIYATKINEYYVPTRNQQNTYL